MKIFQLILSDSITGDLRYAEEIYNGFKIYFSEHEIYKHINNNKKLSKDIIDLINLYDYVFIYNLNDNK